MTTILCRTNGNNSSVVFLLDTLTKQGSIQAWYPETEKLIDTDINYYKTTKSVSDEQEQKMAQQYVQKFGLPNNFTIRRKLYRQSVMPYIPPAQNGITKESSKEVPYEPVESVLPEDKPLDDAALQKLIDNVSEALKCLIQATRK